MSRVEVLEDIRRELRELRLLYRILVEKLFPGEEKTIGEKDEVRMKGTDEGVGQTNVRRKN
jgi:hypothetical protein